MTISHSQLYRGILCAITLGASALLSGCGGDNKSAPIIAPVDPTPTAAVFEVTLINLTAGQPLSPVLAIAHSEA
ncbi:MAG: hypothetical protein K5Q00_01485, partial [Gammaproteobacteria bacterium]|nr:hypothetical protein [Gammaproteobacteria bacterium]